MAQLGTQTIVIALDWSALADDLRTLADKIDPQPTTRTIPWPPSEELIERAARALCVLEGGTWSLATDVRRNDLRAKARAVLDAIGGAS